MDPVATFLGWSLIGIAVLGGLFIGLLLSGGFSRQLPPHDRAILTPRLVCQTAAMACMGMGILVLHEASTLAVLAFMGAIVLQLVNVWLMIKQGRKR